MTVGAPRYFLDSSTLISAVDGASEFQRDCLNVVDMAAKGRINAATSLETLEETLFLLTRLVSKTTALRVTRNYMRLEKMVKLVMTEDTFMHALEVMDITPLNRPKDAINVASMLEHEIPFIVSEDTDYDGIDLVERVHPRELGAP